MDSNKLNPQNPGESGERPRIAATGSKSKYKPGHKVYLNEPGDRSGLQGPFLVEKVPSQGKYTLCFEDGKKAKDGKEYAEKDLST